MSAEPFVGVEEAATFLGVKLSWVYEQCRLGRIPSYKIGAFRRFKLSELEAWVRDRNNGSASDLLPGRQEGARKPA